MSVDEIRLCLIDKGVRTTMPSCSMQQASDGIFLVSDLDLKIFERVSLILGSDVDREVLPNWGHIQADRHPKMPFPVRDR
jgi:hypothetical protein